MENIEYQIRDRVRANVRFASSIVLWDVLALFGILFVTAYTIRLDIAFMEANHMLKSDTLRGAIFQRVFEFEPWVYLAFPLGIVGNAIIASLFAHSQDRYFRRFSAAFVEFGRTWARPELGELGPLERSARDFMFIAQGEFVEEKSRSFQEIKEKMLRDWPRRPRIYWLDQLRFAALSGLLACYFSALCMIVFWHANEMILDLSRTLTTASGGDAPQFFLTQLHLSESLGWGIVFVITCLSIGTGIRFAATTTNASYACGRQLRRFLHGDRTARIFLRNGDPGRGDMAAVNAVLDRLAAELAAKEAAVARGARLLAREEG